MDGRGWGSHSYAYVALCVVRKGCNHPYLPWHLKLIYASGIAEIVLGVAVLLPQMRRMAGWGLIALLIAVFPANIHAALHGFRSLPSWILWARLPFQLVLIAGVYWCCLWEECQREP
jgi:uncharacterized membrane protein